MATVAAVRQRASIYTLKGLRFQQRQHSRARRGEERNSHRPRSESGREISQFHLHGCIRRDGRGASSHLLCDAHVHGPTAFLHACVCEAARLGPVRRHQGSARHLPGRLLDHLPRVLGLGVSRRLGLEAWWQDRRFTVHSGCLDCGRERCRRTCCGARWRVVLEGECHGQT